MTLDKNVLRKWRQFASMYIFSYGSNMLLSRITERINSYKKIRIGYLPKHSLRFHKISKDGSGKADAYCTGKDSDTVWGVIGHISTNDKGELDKFEGLGKGYSEDIVEIITNKGNMLATIYLADVKRIDSNLLPYDWYRDIVVQGCIENQLPKDYTDEVKICSYKKDLDTQRRQKHYEIIEKSGA